jgi:hypothetical protein
MKHPAKSGLNVINGILMLPIVAGADAKGMLVMKASINVALAEKSGKKHFFSHGVIRLFFHKGHKKKICLYGHLNLYDIY